MLFLEQTQGFAAAGAEAAGPQPPSLFELLMQQRMAGGFKPAAEYLAHSLADAYPPLALSLPVRRFEEAYALLRLLVERYFLSRYDGLATEKFYGMKRVLLLPAAEGAPAGAIATAPLTARARRSALLFAVSRIRRSARRGIDAGADRCARAGAGAVPQGQDGQLPQGPQGAAAERTAAAKCGS